MNGEPTESEFEEFFLAFAPAFRRTAYLIVRDWHLADEVTQSAIVKLYRAWPRIRRESLHAYARRVVVNEALTMAKRAGRERPTPDPSQPQSPADPALPFDLERALALLPPGQRAVVALRFLDDLSVGETARVLKIAEGTVKSHTARALRTLRENVPDLVFTEEES